jgi:hypothetical protein
MVVKTWQEIKNENADDIIKELAQMNPMKDVADLWPTCIFCGAWHDAYGTRFGHAYDCIHVRAKKVYNKSIDNQTCQHSWKSLGIESGGQRWVCDVCGELKFS